MDHNVLFGLQEVTTDIEEYLRDLGDNAIFGPHHKVVYSDGHVNERTQYQGLGLATSFGISPLTDADLQDTMNRTGISKVSDDPYSFELVVELPNRADESLMDSNYRYFQILKANIDDRDIIVVNVHYHYHPEVNQKTNDIIVSLIENIGPDIIMGDFNSNPSFDGYRDLLAEQSTFYGPLNGTDRLDHIFIKNELHELWEFGKPRRLFDLKSITLDNINEYRSAISDARILQNLAEVEGELRSVESQIESGVKISRMDRVKPYLLTDENNDQILSDHILFIVDVTTDRGTKFCLATLNILAPHNSTAYPLNPLMKIRIKDISRIVDLTRKIKSTCDTIEADQSGQFGGNYNDQMNVDYRAKYLKYKAKYLAHRK